MDSLTQLTLGAAVGEATLGRKVGNRAMLWGAICGTLPDLDVLFPFADPVSEFTQHRGVSHSLFVLAALTPLVVWVIGRIHPGTAGHRLGWYALVYLAFATHVLLDSFTVYGTQIFWPFDTTPMTWSTIFIIDPLYTLPLLVGVLGALLLGRASPRGHWLNGAGLALSSLYLAWSLGAKLHVEDVARESLADQSLPQARLLTTPTPFNTLLWRVLAVYDGEYYEGFYSLLDPDRHVVLRAYPSDSRLLRGLEDHESVQRLQWFTKGFYKVSREGSAVVISDLRMGLEPDYVFRFKVGEIGNPHARPTPSERLRSEPRLERARWLWDRVWGEHEVVATTTPGPS